MALGSYRVTPAVAVSDMEKAKEFYEGKLGLSGGEDISDGGHTYPAGEGTEIHIYPSPGHAGGSGATECFFRVDDVEKVVDELSSNGVTFERYDEEPIKTDEKGIAELDEDRVAWFKDPDGNILAVGT
jgi:catechol 2,3-dioxygenase-like lactoylglutathione lyase family enzyme